MKTKPEVWAELKTALEAFQVMTEDGKTPMVETTKQRIRIEALLRQMDDLSEKAAA